MVLSFVASKRIGIEVIEVAIMDVIEKIVGLIASMDKESAMIATVMIGFVLLIIIALKDTNGTG